MGLDCKDILKIIHYVINAILMLFSLGLVTAFLMAMVHGKQYVDLMGKYTPLYLFATVFILVVLMIATSMLGCFGAANHSVRSLCVYLGMATLLIVLIAASGIVGWMNYEKGFDEVENELLDSIKTYAPGSDTDVMTKAWDDIQRELKCCGVKNMADWNENDSYRKGRSNKFPESCKDLTTTQDKEAATSYVDGCLDKIEEWTNKNLWNIGFVLAGFVIFMLMSMCVVCMLIASINAYNSDQYDIEMKNLVHK